MPISWVVAFLFVYLELAIVSALSSRQLTDLLQTESFWPLLIMFPAFLFGHAVGLITLNIVAYLIPPFRKTFETEVHATGRHSFTKAMEGLLSFALAYLVLTIVCTGIYLQMAPHSFAR